MAEIIKIASLDIDVEALTAKAAASKAGLGALRKEARALAEEQKENEAALLSYTRKLDDLNAKGYGNTRAAGFFRQKINETTLALDESAVKLSETDAAMKAYQATLELQSGLVGAYAEKQLKAAEAAKQNGTSAGQLGLSLQQNTELYKNLTDTQKDSADTGGRLLKAIQAQEAGYVSLTGAGSGYYSQLVADAVANADKELETYRRLNRSKEGESTLLNETLYANETARLDRVAAAEKEYSLKRKADGLLDEQQYNNEVSAIAEANLAARDAVQKQYGEAAKAQQVTDLEDKRAAGQADLEYDLAFQMEQLEAKKAQELAYAEQTGASVMAVEEKYAGERQAAEKAVADNKLLLASDTFGGLSSILGRETETGKAAAVAQATIDTYKGAVSAYSAMAGIPIVGPALGVAAAAAAVVAGTLNIRKISAAKVKFGQGGLVEGPLHSSGGIPFSVMGQGGYEMEGGEFIVNRGAAARFLPQLQAMNSYDAGQHLGSLLPDAPPLDMAGIKNAVQEGARLGAMEGAMAGTREGAMEGSRIGAREGASLGVSYGIAEKTVNDGIAKGADL